MGTKMIPTKRYVRSVSKRLLDAKKMKEFPGVLQKATPRCPKRRGQDEYDVSWCSEAKRMNKELERVKSL
jgi:hypothetical protein